VSALLSGVTLVPEPALRPEGRATSRCQSVASFASVLLVDKPPLLHRGGVNLEADLFPEGRLKVVLNNLPRLDMRRDRVFD
jgi:hypothetical protein